MIQYLSLLSLGAIWGASFLFMRMSVGSFGPIWLIQFRVGIAAVFLTLVIIYLRKKIVIRNHLKDFAIIGIFNVALPFTLFAYSAQTVTASLLSVINATAPFFAAIFITVFLKKKLSKAQIIGLIVGFCGVGLLMYEGFGIKGDNVVISLIAAICAPVCYGIFSTYITYKPLNIPPLLISVSTLWCATFFLLPFSLSHNFYDIPRSVDWLSVLLLGVMCTGLAYVIFYRLIENMGTISALTVLFLVPFFGTIWGVVFLDEPLSINLITSGILILLGVAISNNLLLAKK